MSNWVCLGCFVCVKYQISGSEIHTYIRHIYNDLWLPASRWLKSTWCDLSSGTCLTQSATESLWSQKGYRSLPQESDAGVPELRNNELVTRTKWSQLSRDSQPKPYRSQSHRQQAYLCFLTHWPRVHFKSSTRAMLESMERLVSLKLSRSRL